MSDSLFALAANKFLQVLLWVIAAVVTVYPLRLKTMPGKTRKTEKG